MPEKSDANISTEFFPISFSGIFITSLKTPKRIPVIAAQSIRAKGFDEEKTVSLKKSPVVI